MSIGWVTLDANAVSALSTGVKVGGIIDTNINLVIDNPVEAL